MSERKPMQVLTPADVPMLPDPDEADRHHMRSLLLDRVITVQNFTGGKA